MFEDRTRPSAHRHVIRMGNPNAFDADYVVRLAGTSEGDLVTRPKVVSVPGTPISNPPTVEVGTVGAALVKEPDRPVYTFNDLAMPTRNFRIPIVYLVLVTGSPPNADTRMTPVL